MLTIAALASAYRTRQTTPSATLRDLLDRIAASPLNSFISVDPETVMRQAADADAAFAGGAPAGALHGIPVAVKDLIDVAGMRTTMGSQQYANQASAERDAQVVARLRAEGAIIVGKTNTHEFAYGLTGDRSYFGAACNPRDPARMTGGSSSGSAAALGAGLCAAALGTDTSASIRLPAALCGVVGLKPTYDLLPRAGAFDLSQTLDHVGPMSATVRDNAVLLDALAGQPAHSYARLAGQSVRGRTVGLATGFYLDYLDAPVRQALEQAQEAFRQAGAQVVPIEIAQVQAIYEAQQLVLKTEAYARHLRALTTNAPYQDEVRARLLTGADVLAVDYLQAMAMRTVARRAFDEALAQVDVLLCPTCGLTAPLRDQRTTALDGQEYSTTWLLTRLTAPTNLSGHPSLSVPFGADSQGLPISMQLIGRHLDEAVLYQFGQALEDAA